jgi:hypothetical protein
MCISSIHVPALKTDASPVHPEEDWAHYRLEWFWDHPFHLRSHYAFFIVHDYMACVLMAEFSFPLVMQRNGDITGELSPGTKIFAGRIAGTMAVKRVLSGENR